MNENNSEKVSENVKNSENPIFTSKDLLWKLTEPQNFIKLRDNFKIVAFQAFKSKFKQFNQENPEDDEEELEEKFYFLNCQEKTINIEEFKKIINQVIQGEFGKYDFLIDQLFREIDCENQDKISWDNFLDYNLKALQPETEIPLHLGQIHYKTPKQIRREPIVKIVLLESTLYFLYALLYKYGKVSLFDGTLTFRTSYSAIMCPEDQFRTGKEMRRRHRWLTDGIFLQDIHMFIIANSTHSLTIYDASGLRHVALWHISGFPHVIQKMLYYTGNDRKQVILGYYNGQLARLSFIKPKEDLLKKKFQDKLSIYYFVELKYHKAYVLYNSLGKIHEDTVLSMEIQDNSKKLLISCSADPKSSLVLMNLEDNSIIYKINLKRGVDCFAASVKHKIILTGSDDCKIRLWNYQDSRIISKDAMQTLKVDNVIVDLAIMETLSVFICYTRSGMLSFYNLIECTQLLFVRLEFELDCPAGSIYPGPKRQGMLDKDKWERNCLLITCNNQFAKVDLYYLDGYDRQLHGELLPPPPIQNAVLIPNDWTKLNQPQTETSIRCSKRQEALQWQDEWMKEIDKKDFVKDLGLKQVSKIHSQIALLEERKSKMKWAVENCAPFMALDLAEIHEISLPQELPVIEGKKSQSIMLRTHKLLNEACAKSIIFSDLSSSKSSKSSRSSRSSAYEFDD